MRHRLARLSFVFALAGSSCGILHFDVDQDVAEQKVAGTPNPIAQFFPSVFSVPITIDIRAQTQAMGTGPAKSANLKSFTLTATRSSGNFDFLDEIHIYVQDNAGALQKKEIASVVPVPRGQTSLTFTIVAGVDLLPYVNAGATISATAMGKQPMSDFYFTGHVTVTVNV